MEILFILLEVPLVCVVLYLDLLALAAAHRDRPPASISPHYRFAFLIPAHNEEKLLPRLLRSIRAMDYPSSLYDVHVVADNCTDRTPVEAANEGAIVHQRSNHQLRSKGYALAWLIERVRCSETPYDAYVIADADSVVSPNFLTAMNNHLARGDQAIQAHDGVLNRGESWVSALSFVALALFNHLRPRAKERLGLSVGLRGNGMCFASSIIERFGWQTVGLVEDHAYHMQLVRARIRVRYAPEASALAEQPTSLGQAYTQSLRWEQGRIPMLVSTAPHLLKQGVFRRDPIALDTLMEQLVPPLSMLASAIFLIAAVTAGLRLLVAFLLASLLTLGLASYVLTGLRLAGASRSTYAALSRAPLYVLWKVWTVIVANAGRQDGRWVRTARSSDEG